MLIPFCNVYWGRPSDFHFFVNIYKLFTYWKENKILKGKTLPPKENSSNPLSWRLIKPSVTCISYTGGWFYELPPKGLKEVFPNQFGGKLSKLKCGTPLSIMPL